MSQDSLLELLRRRRSVRKFKEKKVEEEKVELLHEAVLRAPTSRGRNPWQFIFVDDPQLLRALGQAKQHGSAFVAGAPLAVVVAADPGRSDVWIEDCSIAAILLQMTALSLGLESCWAQIRLRAHDETTSAEDYIRELVGLPEGWKVACVIGIGYGDEHKEGHRREALPWDRLSRNRFGNQPG